MIRDVYQVLAELELCSHVSAVNLDPSSRDAGEDIGGKRPPGGMDRREDRQPREIGERILRSADYFRRQLLRGRATHRVLEDAEAALDAWRHQPMPKEPEFGSPQWKRWISESTLSHGEIARKFNCKRQYVQQVRKQYRAEAA